MFHKIFFLLIKGWALIFYYPFPFCLHFLSHAPGSSFNSTSVLFLFCFLKILCAQSNTIYYIFVLCVMFQEAHSNAHRLSFLSRKSAHCVLTLTVPTTSNKQGNQWTTENKRDCTHTYKQKQNSPSRTRARDEAKKPE